jgi:hypothetical protein
MGCVMLETSETGIRDEAYELGMMVIETMDRCFVPVIALVTVLISTLRGFWNPVQADPVAINFVATSGASCERLTTQA